VINKHIETLCHSCLGDYLEAGFMVVRVPKQEHRDSCTHCQRRQGWDYEIKSKRKKEGGNGEREV